MGNAVRYGRDVASGDSAAVAEKRAGIQKPCPDWHKPIGTVETLSAADGRRGNTGGGMTVKNIDK
jgi:hypothetical protein